ncbi:polysaccharide deacetylase family protein [Andreprevotia chitinilytica]|uniref:polysaccharide deacetylase family protein n=1 Tax=Andreprevotia chitinilytica TaxID=396808 RepID=UPI000A4FBE0C|nr:polysaccharide deacetylase family protein [Andreprevotia chitinilytica]
MRRKIAYGLAAVVAVMLAVWWAWEWLPPAPPGPSAVAADAPKGPPKVRTPFRNYWGQTPLADMERQGTKYPHTVFLEGPKHRRWVALTFDDGPSEYTSSLLDVLKKHGVKATFFMMGTQMDLRPWAVQRAWREGHMLGNHTYTHPHLSELDPTYFWDEEIGKTQGIFKRIVGFEPKIMRPPYGEISDSEIEDLDRRGLKVIQWSLDTQDWYRNRMLFGAHNIERATQEATHEEAIILMHDGGGKRYKTVEAVDKLIPWLKAGGYEFVTVDQMLGLPKQPRPG